MEEEDEREIRVELALAFLDNGLKRVFPLRVVTSRTPSPESRNGRCYRLCVRPDETN